ncbi:DUF2442 domain-containing protein [Limnothrix redekei]|uniref:DUF2442 domain-containing protein n=1 Tax=Limnothrix redekei LRLZ20PSL1 TaxID=3112953 RepID=A0ABW7CA20_9CYAN
MLKDIISVKPIQDYQLFLTFEDNQQGIVDLIEIIEFTGIFEALKNHEYFLTVRVDPDLGTICWDNGADIDPVILYSKLSQPDRTLADLRDRLLPQSFMSGEIRVKEAEKMAEEVL